jgi:flagellar protein FliS
MAASAAINCYRRTAVETVDTGRLVLMAYEGALQALTGAQEALEARDYEEKGRLTIRAQDFMSELLAGLNPEAGDLATNLRSLYVFMLKTLYVVDPAGEKGRLDRVRAMLETLHSAWQTVVNGPALREVPKAPAQGLGVEVVG